MSLSTTALVHRRRRLLVVLGYFLCGLEPPSGAIRQGRRSSRCSIRRRAFRRRSPATSATGASARAAGGPSPPRRLSLAVAGCFVFDHAAARDVSKRTGKHRRRRTLPAGEKVDLRLGRAQGGKADDQTRPTARPSPRSARVHSEIESESRGRFFKPQPRLLRRRRGDDGCGRPWCLSSATCPRTTSACFSRCFRRLLLGIFLVPISPRSSGRGLRLARRAFDVAGGLGCLLFHRRPIRAWFVRRPGDFLLLGAALRPPFPVRCWCRLPS